MGDGDYSIQGVIPSSGQPQLALDGNILGSIICYPQDVSTSPLLDFFPVSAFTAAGDFVPSWMLTKDGYEYKDAEGNQVELKYVSDNFLFELLALRRHSKCFLV